MAHEYQEIPTTIILTYVRLCEKTEIEAVKKIKGTALSQEVNVRSDCLWTVFGFNKILGIKQDVIDSKYG